MPGEARARRPAGEGGGEASGSSRLAAAAVLVQSRNRGRIARRVVGEAAEHL